MNESNKTYLKATEQAHFLDLLQITPDINELNLMILFKNKDVIQALFNKVGFNENTELKEKTKLFLLKANKEQCKEVLPELLKLAERKLKEGESILPTKLFKCRDECKAIVDRLLSSNDIDLSEIKKLICELNIKYEFEKEAIDKLNDISTQYENKLYTDCCTSCGVILEIILKRLIEDKYKKCFLEAISAPKQKDGNMKDISKWNIQEIINVYLSIGLINKITKSLCEHIIFQRNCIHLAERLREKFEPDEKTAKTTLCNLSEVLRFLKKQE